MNKATITGTVAAALIIAAPAVASHRFTDVPTGHPHHDAIGWAYDEGLTAGCTEDRFCPEQPVTRGQMATFLFRNDLRESTRDNGGGGTTTVRQHVVTKIGPGLVECPAGTFVVGGGFRVSGQEQHEIYASHPIARSEGFDREGWNVSVNYNGSQGEPISQAVCLEVIQP